ncbi:MAG: class I SAM-dependent methyltransferase, partial [Phormidesmis sp.]
MRPDSAVVFADKARVYGTYRPEHPQAVIDVLQSRLAPGSTIADIGAGTGRLSQRLAQAGFWVKLVEPNAQMRSIAADRVRTLGDAVTVLAAEANHTQ